MNQNSELLLHHYTENAYLEYAVATVKGRALAQVQDGLKPVQRRILYTMRQLGLDSTAKPVKSARVVGDVLGKYHPHGDQAAYDAMVRMAQTFTLRYPLVIGQGNFGSRDGDSAAAMRYTEAKLAPIAELLLSELNMGTAILSPNYDGTLQEPELLPARLPFLLLNGTMGIAVGLAADVPPHNLREVASAADYLLHHDEASLSDVLTFIKGPDFPDGGELVSSESEIHQVYASGRGSLRCRAKWEREDLARGQWQIVIKELPYQVSTRVILEQLEALTNPQPPSGKKTIMQQQANAKQLALEFLEKAVDESDKDNNTRLVLVPRTSKVDEAQMMAFLLSHTSLECNVSVNMTMVGLDGRPTLKTLLEVLQEWVSYRQTVVRKRTQWQLDGALKRLHILEGRLTVFLRVEEVIQVIREADEPKQSLMSQFGLSDIQAEDILEMRLRQLNRLEGFKLEREMEELKQEVARLNEILASDARLKAVVSEEIRHDALKYGDDRRTQCTPQTKSVFKAHTPKVLAEPLTVVLSENLWLKAYKGHGLDAGGFNLKAQDSVAFTVELSSTDPLYILDSAGRAYTCEASVIPSGRGEGAPLSTFVELQNGAIPIALMVGPPEQEWVFASSNGYGFRAPLKSLSSRNKAGKAFMSLGEGDQVLPPQACPQEGVFYAGLISSENRVLCFDGKDIKQLPGGGKGVQLIALGDSTLKTLALFSQVRLMLDIPAQGRKKARQDIIEDEAAVKWISKRAKKGQAVDPATIVSFVKAKS